MKKRFTLMITALLLMIGSLAWGQSREEVVAYTLDGTVTGGSAGYAEESNITQNGLSWKVMGNTTMNPWRIGGKNLSNTDRPVYSTGTISDNITKIVVTHGNANNITVNSMILTVSANADFSNPTSTITGDFAANGTTTFTRPVATDWTGKYYKIVYNVSVSGNSNRFVQFISAEFYKESGGMESVATPTFSPEAGSYTTTQNVAISCTTEGATIYYTLDGNNPTTSSAVYSSPIAISETTTVKAMAAKTGMNNSSIATAVYNFPVVYANIAAWKAAHTATSSVVSGISGDLTAVFQSGTTLYVQDATGGLLIYGSLGKTYNNGDVISGGVFGTSQLYNGTMEFKPTSTFPDGVAGTAVEPAVVTVAEILADYSAYADRLVKIEGITFDADHTFATNNNTGRTTTFTQGESSMTCYDSFKVLGGFEVTEGENADIIGLAGCYNATRQIFPRSTADIIEALPTYYNVTVAAGITNGTVSVDPTSAIEGATVTVTADPAQGYELTALTYTYAGVATPIDILEAMQFVMPAADVTVDATFTELAHVANPTFAPAAGQYITAQEVTIACATEGATIHYTLDGTDPTTESPVYAEAFTVSTTTTVKAMAVKEGMNNSDVVSVAYTIIQPITIAEAKALETNQYGLVQGVVTFIDGRNIYVQDATAGIVLYLNNNTVPAGLALGDMVLGYGKKAVYNGLIELSGINGGNANNFVIVSSGNPLPVAEKTIAEILADHNGDKLLQSTRVQIVEATVGTINTSSNTPITQGESTLNIYKMPVVEGLEEGDLVTVTGVIGCYNAVQLRVALASDVTFTHPAGIFVNPTALSGFNYVYEEGPSNVKTFNISARSLTAPTHIYAPENYEMSSFPGDNFYPESHITINTYTGVYNYTIKVRLKAGLEIGDYNEEITINQEEIGTMTIALSGSVTGEPPTPVGYTRVSDLSQVTNGAKIVFAARFDENANQYYAMTAQASGKPTGVLFTSETTNGEVLPAEITDEEANYYWTVAIDGDNYTFTNANGDVLGYTSSTNFSPGGDNTAWAITYQTSEATAMVPEYSAFVINNVNNAVRAIALNGNHNFGPYHTQNIASETYNFFLDIFATAGGTPICATPTFTPEAGTYYEEQEVAISCGTPEATIYYTIDGSDPTTESEVYTEPIAVATNMTIKALAVKEGYDNSNIATADYTIILGAVTIFQQDWEGEMNGWTFVTVEGSKPWTIASYSGNHYAYGNGYNGGANEQWCISPAFSLNVYSNVSLTFRNAKNYTGPDLQLYFSNDYNGETPETATWTELTFNMSTGSFAWAESGTIDLAGFAGDECYIGFKYTSTETEAAAWEVDDITLVGFTTEPYLTVTPNALSGFSYIVGNGPSAAQTFTVSGGNLPPAPGGTSGGVNISISNSNFELSLDGEVYSNNLSIEVVGTLEPTTVYVRLEAGLPVYEYIGMIFIEDGGTTVSVSVIGNVTEEPQPGGDWNRIYALSDLNDGDQIILAARYDATIGNGYYAMTAGVSGKPEGVLFTSVDNAGVEQLPAEIADNADTYLWNVTLDGDVITLVNAAGDSLGYSSSTNFSGGVQTEWNIALQTSEEGALIPNYTAFVITNAETTNRGIAKNNQNKFGAYSTSNISNPDYNFFLDIFVQGGVVTPTVATPVFSMASGTYYETIEVEITCATEGATIYYTTDGSDPTAESEIYTEALVIEETTTLKAIAMMEGYDDSGIATANYVIMSGVVVLLEQDWEGEMNGWTFVTIEGNKPWTIGSYSGNHYANANGYGDDVDNEQWCISPDFNLNGRAYENVTLTFKNAMKFEGPALEVYFSNDYDGQDPGDATWIPLEYVPSPGNYTWTESGEISLDAFSGAHCYIGFRYISTVEDGAAAWEVDDIMITAEPGSSVITAEASLNVAVWNSNNELMIVNNGDEALNVMVYNIIGQPVLSETIATGSNVIRHDLAEGIYIVRIANGKEMTGIKVVVRR